MWHVALHELRLQFRDGRLAIAGGALFVLLLTVIVSGWMQYDQTQREREAFTSEVWEQWVNQGERHPHRAAHFGTYAVKPELSLALFEPGLRPFAGQTLWLEAHSRPAFSNVPSEDDLTLSTGLGVVSGSGVLQLLGCLFALVIGALSIVRERETHTLRQSLSQGVNPGAWVGGKFTGLAATLAVPLVPAAVIAFILFLVFSPVHDRGDLALRALVMLASNGLLILCALMVGLIISARSQSSRGALLLALGFWIAAFVFAPRFAASISERTAPAPTLSAYQAAVGEEFNSGFDARGGYMEQLTVLQEETRKKYGVDDLKQLPTGFSGIRMKHLDAWSTEVDERHYARLLAQYDRQTNIRLVTSIFSPFVAARNVSQGMAGMDWAHYQNFLEAAEAYRRKFGLEMNELIEKNVKGVDWEMDGTNEDWAKIEPFEYHIPTAGWAIGQQIQFLFVLLLWALGAAFGLLFTTRGLKP